MTSLDLTAHMDAEGRQDSIEGSMRKSPALLSSGGKHRGLWQRMKSKQLERQDSVVTEDDLSIPNAVTLSSDDDEDGLLGTQFEEQNSENHDPQQEDVLTTFLGSPFPHKASAPPTGETPGLYWKQWSDQMSESPASTKLMQEDIIQSPNVDEDSSQDLTRLSFASLDQSLAQTPSSDILYGGDMPDNVPPSGSPLSNMRRNSMHQAMQESHVYLTRIHELEEALMATKAQLVVAQSGDVFGDSAEDMVDALGRTPLCQNTTATAPSRYHALWQRNQTLVKEVRFAEQTCVEISERHKALQTQVGRLEQANEHKNQEVDRLQQELRHAENVLGEWKAMSDPLQMEELKALCQERLEQIQSLEEDKTTAADKIAELKLALERAEGARQAGGVTLHNEKLAADTAIVAKELELSRASESNLQTSLSELKERLEILQKEKAELTERLEENSDQEPNSLPSPPLVALSSENVALKADLQISRERLKEIEEALRAEKQAHDDAERRESEKMKELKVAHALKVRQVEEVYVERTQMALRSLEVQMIDFQRQAQSKVNSYNFKLMSLTSAMELLRNSLEFPSETHSLVDGESETHLSVSEGSLESIEDEPLTGESLVQTPPRNSIGGQAAEFLGANVLSLTPERDSIGVLNATLSRNGTAMGGLEEELLIEQMEEARHQEAEEEEGIEGLSHIESSVSDLEISSLVSDCSMQSKSSETSGFYVKSILPYLDGENEPSSDKEGSIKEELISIEDECGRLKFALEYLRGSTSVDQEHVRATIDDQNSVLQCIMDKFAYLVHKRVSQGELGSKWATEELAESKRTCALLKVKLHSTQSALNTVCLELEQKTKEATTLAADRMRLIEQCESLSHSAEEAIRMRDNQKDLVRQIEATADEQITSLKQRLEIEERRSTHLENKVEEFEQQQTKTDTHSLKGDLLQTEAKLQELEKAHESTQKELVRAIETNGKGAKLVARYETELLEAQSIADGFEDEIASAKSSAAQAAAALSCIEMELEQLRRKMNDQNGAMSILEKENANFVSKYEAAHSALCDASRTRSDLEARLKLAEAARDDLAQKESLEEVANSNQVEQLQIELESMKAEMECVKLAYLACNDKLANVSEQNASKDSIVEQYQKAHEAAKEMVEHSESRLADVKRELEEALLKKVEMEDHVHAVNEELRLSTDDLNRLLERHSEERDSSMTERDGDAAFFEAVLTQIVSNIALTEQAILETVKQVGITVKVHAGSSNPAADGMTTESCADERLRSMHASVRAVVSELADTQLRQDRAETTLGKESRRADLLAEKLRFTEGALAEAEAEVVRTVAACREAQEDFSRVTRTASQDDESIERLQAKNVSLEHKCERLRDYIRKLTVKCDEWAESYEKQSKLLQHHQSGIPCPSQRGRSLRI